MYPWIYYIPWGSSPSMFLLFVLSLDNLDNYITQKCNTSAYITKLHNSRLPSMLGVLKSSDCQNHIYFAFKPNTKKSLYFTLYIASNLPSKHLYFLSRWSIECINFNGFFIFCPYVLECLTSLVITHHDTKKVQKQTPKLPLERTMRICLKFASLVLRVLYLLHILKSPFLSQ